MQNRENCYENVWILSGTSDGPVLASMLLDLNYSVFTSVVTHRAVKSFLKNPKLHIITGKLNDVDEISFFIKKNRIKIVIDATHPFALIISENLKRACKETHTPLLIFERKPSLQKSENFNYISGLKDIQKCDVNNKNILLAIGSRLLSDTANYYTKSGANVFARIIPTHEGISKALGSCIKNSNIAILEPSKSDYSYLEKKLCEFWNIDYVICRESGSYSQKNWEKIVSKSKMKLFLVKRPNVEYSNSLFFS